MDEITMLGEAILKLDERLSSLEGIPNLNSRFSAACYAYAHADNDSDAVELLNIIKSLAP